MGAGAIRIYGLWPAHLFLSCTPGLIIAQSCLTSYEAAPVCLPACLAASPDRWEGGKKERRKEGGKKMEGEDQVNVKER